MAGGGPLRCIAVFGASGVAAAVAAVNPVAARVSAAAASIDRVNLRVASDLGVGDI